MLKSNVLFDNTCKSIGFAEIQIIGLSAVFGKGAAFPGYRNFECYQRKSFVDDLIGTGHCKHESRLALRSAEVHPVFYDLSFIPPFSIFSAGVEISFVELPASPLLFH